MKTLMTNIRLLLALLVVTLITTSCEDPIPTDYTEELVIEGFVIVGEPLANIRVMRTLPISDTFSFKKAAVNDATVRVFANNSEIAIEFVADSFGGSYRARDASYRVLPSSSYQIRVKALGKTLEATTITPIALSWIKEGPNVVQFPHPDSLLFPGADSLAVSWSQVPNTEFYIIGLECLDTLGYGKYLTPASSDTNTRTPRPKPDFFNRDGTLVSNERTIFGGTIFSASQTIWGVFRWHGRHRLNIYAPNKEFLEWFYQVGSGRRSSYDYRLSNIKGGLGVWGGASLIRTEKFLLKYGG
ncbi:MAG: DUF4249 family protein [Ignavibacteria bacterium]|nr:DUF4249 family protein [Ignavibacteria bacterium]